MKLTQQNYRQQRANNPKQKKDLSQPVNGYAEVNKFDQLDEYDLMEFKEILDQDY